MSAVRYLGWVLLAVVGCGSVAGALTQPGTSGGTNASTAEPRAAVDRVVVVAVPGLGWDDVTAGSMPTFSALAGRGASAALSVKTIGRRTERAEAYATIGAGARTTAPDHSASSGRAVTEQLASGRTAGEELRARGVDPGEAAIVVLGTGAVVAANADQHQGARIGALAGAVHGRGWSTALVANHDHDQHIDRTAALAVTTRSGRVDYGSVSSSLTSQVAGKPAQTAPGPLAAAVSRLPAQRVLALVEVGDVAWADALDADGTDRRRAVERADGALAAVEAELGPHDLLIVLAPTAPSEQEQPTPFAVAGPGVEPGLARSATTRRAGYVTLPDVSATILDRIGAAVPESMSGTPITISARAGADADRLTDLRNSIAETRFVDRSAGIFLVTLPIVFACWSLLALLATVVPLGVAAPVARGFVRWFGLGIAVVPIVTFLVAAFTVRSWGQPRWSGVVWLLAAAAAVSVAWLRPASRAALLLSALVWAVLVLDVVTGARLQFDSPLGNSPTVAGRFSGIGNLAFGLLAATTVVLAVALWRATDRVRPGWLPLGVAGGVFAVAIVVDGAPGLGADVGGVLTLGPVAILTLWTLAGRRLSLARLVGAAAATLTLVGGFIALDLTRPESSQTHLGRLARSASDGDGADVLRRKADAALGSFGRSSLVWIVISTVLLALLLWALARPAMRRLTAEPLARPLLLGGTLLAVLGAALNDSGVMVPAMMATVFVPLVVHLLLAPDGPLTTPAPTPTPERP